MSLAQLQQLLAPQLQGAAIQVAYTIPVPVELIRRVRYTVGSASEEVHEIGERAELIVLINDGSKLYWDLDRHIDTLSPIVFPNSTMNINTNTSIHRKIYMKSTGTSTVHVLEFRYVKPGQADP